MSDEPELQDVPLETPETEQPPQSLGSAAVPAAVQTPAQSTQGTLAAKPENDPKDQDSVIVENGGGDSDKPVEGNGQLQTQKKMDLPAEAKRSSVVDQVMKHSPGDGLKQLAYLEILMADSENNVTDRDVVDSVLNVVSKKIMLLIALFLERKSR